VRIESVRLHDFLAGDERTSRQRAAETRGLLRDVKASIKAVDDALLLADRAMFLAQREPFLLRMQARLGFSEILSDSLEDLHVLDQVARTVEGRVDRLLRRCLFYLAALGLVWSLLFWGGYYASKRLLGARSAPVGSGIEEPRL